MPTRFHISGRARTGSLSAQRAQRTQRKTGIGGTAKRLETHFSCGCGSRVLPLFPSFSLCGLSPGAPGLKAVPFLARGRPPCPKMPRTCPVETSTCPQSPSICLGFDPVGVGKIFLERKVRKGGKGGRGGNATGTRNPETGPGPPQAGKLRPGGTSGPPQAGKLRPDESGLCRDRRRAYWIYECRFVIEKKARLLQNLELGIALQAEGLGQSSLGHRPRWRGWGKGSQPYRGERGLRSCGAPSGLQNKI